MQFGAVENPDLIDFSLPPDHPENSRVLSGRKEKLEIYIGCTTWSKTELKGFYPRGIKEPLGYYSSQFNAIEFNASYYRIFDREQVSRWIDQVDDGFRFFPKVHQDISHTCQLKDVNGLVNEFCKHNLYYGNHLGVSFLQMQPVFGLDYFDRIEPFFQIWNPEMPLAIELRHHDWYRKGSASDELFHLIETYGHSTVITDTAGRRDLLHMRLTSSSAFIRYVGTNHPSDYTRLTAWADRIKSWSDLGLKNLYFFVHQLEEQESPSIAAHFISLLNKHLGLNMQIPKGRFEDPQLKLL